MYNFSYNIQYSESVNRINLLICCSGSVATIKILEIIDCFNKSQCYNISK